MAKIHITSNFGEALRNRYQKYFRFNNSRYWTQYYKKKLVAKDFSREGLYASLIARSVGINGRVLDVGSGYGFLAKELVEHELEVHCVDLFEEMMLLARTYLKGANVKLKQTDILNLPYKKLSFDCISLMSIIEHFPYEEVNEDIIPYIKQFIKDSGYLFVHAPVRSTCSLLTRIIRKYLVKDLPIWAIDDDGDVTHKIWMSYKDYIKLFESHNFRLVNFDFHLKRSNRKPQILADIMSVAEKLFGDTDQTFERSFEEENGRTKFKKLIKSNFSLTSYLLFRKVA